MDYGLKKSIALLEFHLILFYCKRRCDMRESAHNIFQ